MTRIGFYIAFVASWIAHAAATTIDCSSGKGAPTTSLEVSNPYPEIVSIRTCSDINGCIGVGNSTTHYGDCNFQVISPKSTVTLIFDAMNPHAPPHRWPVLDAVQYLVFDNGNTGYPGWCTQSKSTMQQSLSRDEFWGKASYPIDNVTWPPHHTIDFPQRTCHFCGATARANEYTMEVINPYTKGKGDPYETFVKVRACRHAKCSGDPWQPAHYDDCYDKILSEQSAKVHLDDSVQYVVFSCTGIENNGLETLYKPKAGWPHSVKVECKEPVPAPTEASSCATFEDPGSCSAGTDCTWCDPSRSAKQLVPSGCFPASSAPC